MKITPIFKIKVTAGQTSMPDEEYRRFRLWLTYNAPDGEYEFTVSKKFKRRSLPQNSYFHGVVLPMIADYTGDDQAEVKAFLKGKFLSKEKSIKGKENQIDTQKIIGRTSKLDSYTFYLFVEKCRAWASEFLGVVIPDPDPNYQNYAYLVEED